MARTASRGPAAGPLTCFTFAAILLFALSIGAATFVFSLVKALLFESIPYPES